MSKKIVRLLSGSLEGESTLNEAQTSLDKPAMLVYMGKFESMDGPVDITDDDIEKLAANHNGLLSKLSRLATGEVSLKHNPPIQLDHSTSARDTVGRLVGNLTVGEHTDEEGNKVKALFGVARVLGKENIEKVQDGRWTHLSGGFDLENHKVTELTITPFPAAADASLLSKNRLGKVSYEGKYKGVEFQVISEGGGFSWKIDGQAGGRVYPQENGAVIAAKAAIDGGAGLSKLSTDKGDDMPGYKDLKEKMGMYDKCKKHLMDKEKLSEEAVEEKLSAMDDESLSKMSAERDEEDKKLASEAADKEKSEKAKKDEELKRMSAMKGNKEKLIQLSKGIKATNSKVQLAAKALTIRAKLSRLASQQKITPAEMKTLKVDELAGKSDEAITAALSSYEKREPVIDVGLYGTTKALSAAQLQGTLKKLGMERLELQTRLNMPSKRDGALKRLAELGEEEKTVQVHIDNVPQGEHDVDFEAAYGTLKQLMAEGKEDEAKAHFKSHMGKKMADDSVAGDQTAEVSSLAEEVKNLHASFEEVVKLAAPVFGATAEELA